MTSTDQAALQSVMDAAIRAGVLPAGTTVPESAAPERPWPIILLTTLGAWLAVIPLCGLLVLMFGSLLSSGAGPYFLGPVMLAGAVMVLRSDQASIFVEQLAVPLLLLGGGTLAYGLYRDLEVMSASLIMAGVVLVTTVAVRRRWIQVLLGGTCCMLVLVFIAALSSHLPDALGFMAPWLWLRSSVLVWIGLLLWKRQLGGSDGGLRGAVEALGAGWILATLASLALSTGSSFLVGALMDFRGNGGTDGMHWFATGQWLMTGLSLLMTVAGAAWLWRCWPALRQPWCAGCGAVMIALTWFIPVLGPVWLALAVAVTEHRWRVASAAGLAAVWILGSFYYSLALPLATKAAVLAGAGALLGGLVLWGRSGLGHAGAKSDTPSTAGSAAPDSASPRQARLGIALTALATLAAVNVAIWQKEDLIRHGRAIYIELAPVDPRSLMQGDYMALSYRMSPRLRDQIENQDSLETTMALAKVDARGVATLDRLAGPADKPATDELPVMLMAKNGRWSVVSDAWYFKEGTGAHWQVARYGEFRVMPDGRALLVGMADEALRPIRPVDSLPVPPADAAPASAGQ